MRHSSRNFSGSLQNMSNHDSRITNDKSPLRRLPMGRGAQAQTQQMIDQQLSQQNNMNQQLYGSSQSLGSQAASGYQNLLANPGYSPAEQSAITNLRSRRCLPPLTRWRRTPPTAPRARATPPATANSSTPSRALRARIRPTSRSKIKSPSPTPRAPARSRLSPDFPASTALTPTCSAAPSASPRNSSTPAPATPPPAASTWASAPPACPSASGVK